MEDGGTINHATLTVLEIQQCGSGTSWWWPLIVLRLFISERGYRHARYRACPREDLTGSNIDERATPLAAVRVC